MSNNKINSLIVEEHIKTLFSIFKNQNTEIRLVGGSIRDLLINREIRDIDSATELEPNDVLDLLKKNNMAIMKLTDATKISMVHAMYISFLPQGAVTDLGKNL